jgi:hypothetical protein
MANYTTAALATAQAKLMGKFQAGELRYRDPVTFKQYIRSTNIMMPDLEAIKKSSQRTVNAFYFERQSRSLTTGITYNHTGTKGSVGTLTPSWTVYSDKFKQALKQANNNLYQLQEMANNEVENLVKNFAEGLESQAVTHAFNNRSGVNDASAEGSFNDTQDVFEIFTSKEKRGAQIAQSVMDENDFAGPYIVLCDPIAFNKFMYYSQQGSQNSENLQFQFDNMQFVRSNGLYSKFSGLGTPYTDGAFIVVPEGMLAALPWIEPQYRNAESTQQNRYSTLVNPIDGLTYGVHEYDERYDGSSEGGYNQDVKTEVEAHIQLALEHAPLSSGTPLLAMAFKEESTA